MSNQMWIEQNAKHKNTFVQNERNATKNIVEKYLRGLILKQYQSADFKSIDIDIEQKTFWNAF